MPGPPVEAGGAGVSVCSPRGPIPSEIEAGGPRKGGGSRAPQWKSGQSASPLLHLRAIGNIAINFPHLHSTPSTPASPGTWVRRSETPVTGWPLLPSLEPNFRRGPRRGVPEKEAPPRWFGEGAGRPVPGWRGERDRLGEVPERTGPGREERPPPAPQQSKSSSPSSQPQVLARPRRPSAQRRNRERPLPKPKGVVGEVQELLWLVGRARGSEIRPSAEPQSPCGCLGPSPSLPREQGLGGLRHKEVVVEGDAKSLKGECTSAILEGRKRKRREKKGRKKDGRGELGQGPAGVGRRREKARLGAYPHRGL